MPNINLETFIRADAERCFDLARDIGAHAAAYSPLRHRAVAGVTSGLIGPGEEVTWEATFFGVRLRMTSRVTAFERPSMFRDEMVSGPFKLWRHTHLFEPAAGGTLLRDRVEYASPLGALGAAFDALYLKRFLKSFLVAHNADVRWIAEYKGNVKPPRVDIADFYPDTPGPEKT